MRVAAGPRPVDGRGVRRPLLAPVHRPRTLVPVIATSTSGFAELSIGLLTFRPVALGRIAEWTLPRAPPNPDRRTGHVNIARTLGCTALALTLIACAGNDREGYTPSPDELARFERVTEFDGRVLEIDMPRGDGTRDRFNTVRDEWYSWSYVPARLGHAGRRWTLGKTTATHTTMVYALVSWNDDNPTDYLAAGWWLRFPGRYSFLRGLSLLDAEGSAFIDGPELDISSPPRLPS